MFHVNFDTSADKFQNYYKDVSLRMKNREIDLLIVVNMFLTGFDSPRLNTLYVDKNLRFHGLIQAFSRTNRILNDRKSQGNVVCFRNLKKATDEAMPVSLISRANSNDSPSRRNASSMPSAPTQVTLCVMTPPCATSGTSVTK